MRQYGMIEFSSIIHTIINRCIQKHASNAHYKRRKSCTADPTVPVTDGIMDALSPT
jgi:hypothetical protein